MEKGVSAVTVNSEKGVRLRQRLEVDGCWTETIPESVNAENPALLHEAKESIPALRREIYGKIRREGWEAVAGQHLRTPHLELKKLWYRMPRKLTGLLRKLTK